MDPIQKLVKSIDLSRFPLKITLRWFPDKMKSAGPVSGSSFQEYGEAGFVELSMVTQNRETGRPLNVSGIVAVTMIPGGLSEEETTQLLTNAEDTVYNGIMRLVLHELSECYLVGGKRIRDPHRVKF